MVSSGEIVREHSGHVAVCCSAIGASPNAKGTGVGLPPGGTTPACVTPDAQWSASGKVAPGALFGRSGIHLMRISGKDTILSLPAFNYSDVTLCRGDLRTDGRSHSARESPRRDSEWEAPNAKS